MTATRRLIDDHDLGHFKFNRAHTIKSKNLIISIPLAT